MKYVLYFIISVLGTYVLSRIQAKAWLHEAKSFIQQEFQSITSKLETNGKKE